MKIKTALISGFLAIALILVTVAGVSAFFGERSQNALKVLAEKYELSERINDFSENLNEENAYALRYISSDDPEELPLILSKKEDLYDDNCMQMDSLIDDFIMGGRFTEQIKEINESWIEKKEIFNNYVDIQNLKKYNDTMFYNLSNELVNTINVMKVNYFENPTYTEALTENHLILDLNISVQTLFQMAVYFEKEYLWQYKDQSHYDELVDILDNIKILIPITNLPLDAKNELMSLIGIYEDLLVDVPQYMDENDIRKLSALEVKYRRKLYSIKHDSIRDEWIDNPAFGDSFYLFIIYPWNGTDKTNNLNQLYYELGEKEKEFIFKENATTGFHYYELLSKIEESKAYVNATDLDPDNKTALISVFDSYLGIVYDFIDVHSKYISTIDQLEREKTDIINMLGQKMDIIKIGDGPNDTAGLDYIIGVIHEDYEEANQDYNEATMLISLITLIGILGSILAAIVLGLVIARHISKPILDMTDSVRMVKEGNMNITVEEKGNDEIVELAQVFNQMTLNLKREIVIREKSEEDLMHTVDRLERSNKELKQFAHISAHDLQEPLRMISSYVQLLERRYKDKLDDNAREMIDFAVEGTKRMHDLLNDLIVYSNLDIHDNSLQPVDCTKVIKRTLGIMRPTIEESGALITYDPLPTIMAIDSQFAKLSENLISNAIKFRGSEPPKIHISAEPTGEEWLFSVRDNGMGIESEYTDRIFRIFQRLHKRNEYPGTGMGLTICKKIVERNGGHIWVESKPKIGSTFFFTMPKSRGET